MADDVRCEQTIQRARPMYKDSATADVLELLHLNQIDIRAAVEEVSTWQRGSVKVHDNVMTDLRSLVTNADAIESAIEH